MRCWSFATYLSAEPDPRGGGGATAKPLQISRPSIDLYGSAATLYNASTKYTCRAYKHGGNDSL